MWQESKAPRHQEKLLGKQHPWPHLRDGRRIDQRKRRERVYPSSKTFTRMHRTKGMDVDAEKVTRIIMKLERRRRHDGSMFMKALENLDNYRKGDADSRAAWYTRFRV